MALTLGFPVLAAAADYPSGATTTGVVSQVGYFTAGMLLNSYEDRSYNWKANFPEKQREIMLLIANSLNSG